MKSLSLLFLVALKLNAATWTFHGGKDNYSGVELWTPTNFYLLQWDYQWDQQNPTSQDSGITLSTPWSPSGYADVLSIDLDDSWSEAWVAVSGPAPDYMNMHLVYNNVLPISPGEYWIDFDNLGGIRVSTIAPSDFGKWAWDGSINPNYVAPLSLNKHHGHKT